MEDKINETDKNVEFSYLYLIDKDLRWCRGCLICMKKGGASCPLKDDGEAIKEVIDSADGLIFASPGYAHQVSALFKNFMDRFMYLDHLPEYIGIPALVLVTAETDGAQAVAKYINLMHAHIWGCDVAGKLGIHYAFFNTNKTYRAKYMKKIEKLTNSFYEMLIFEGRRKPTFLQYLCFVYNKKESELYEEIFPARFEYWKKRGWLDMDYYYDTKISLHHKAAGWLIFLIIERYIKECYGKNYKVGIKNYFTRA